MNIQFEAHSFIGYKHTVELKAKFSAARMGSNNPMFGKTKSVSFLAHQRKPSEIFIYDLNMNLVSRIFGFKAISKEFHISDKTVSKYKDTNKPFIIFFLNYNNASRDATKNIRLPWCFCRLKLN